MAWLPCSALAVGVLDGLPSPALYPKPLGNKHSGSIQRASAIHSAKPPDCLVALHLGVRKRVAGLSYAEQA